MRYQIDDRAIEHGCCYTAAIVDTARPVLIQGEPYAPDGVIRYETVCECSAEDAGMICAALNAKEKSDGTA